MIAYSLNGYALAAIAIVVLGIVTLAWIYFIERKMIEVLAEHRDREGDMRVVYRPALAPPPVPNPAQEETTSTSTAITAHGWPKRDDNDVA